MKVKSSKLETQSNKLIYMSMYNGGVRSVDAVDAFLKFQNVKSIFIPYYKKSNIKLEK